MKTLIFTHATLVQHILCCSGIGAGAVNEVEQATGLAVNSLTAQ